MGFCTCRAHSSALTISFGCCTKYLLVVTGAQRVATAGSGRVSHDACRVPTNKQSQKNIGSGEVAVGKKERLHVLEVCGVLSFVCDDDDDDDDAARYRGNMVKSGIPRASEAWRA